MNLDRILKTSAIVIFLAWLVGVGNAVYGMVTLDGFHPAYVFNLLSNFLKATYTSLGFLVLIYVIGWYLKSKDVKTDGV